MTDGSTRRGFLRLAGSASVLGLAGCTGGGPGGTPEPTPTPRPTPEPTPTPDDEHHGEEGEHGGEEGDHAETEPGDGSHDGGSHEEGGHHHADIPEEPVDHAEVTMVTTGEEDGFHFEPHVVWVHPGGRVTWTIESGDHSATAYHPDNDRPGRVPDGAASWDSGLLTEQGEDFEHTFERAGVYDYYCIPHEAMGMIGSVLVGRPEPAEQPGLASPQSRLPEDARSAIESRNDTVLDLLEGSHHEEEGSHDEEDAGHDG